MRVQALLGLVVILSNVVIGGPAWAKGSIAEAIITGPGLDSGIRIATPDTEGLWDSGIDVAGGLDDMRAGSVGELGLTPADLGPRYVITYRFVSDDSLVRQDLYPYARDGPVTYTAPGQALHVGVDLPVTSGWFQSPSRFFEYLVDQGLPRTMPVAAPSTNESAPVGAPETPTPPWRAVVVGVVVLAALLLAAAAFRRRMNG